MPTNDERGIVSKSKLTALATAIKTKAEVSGTCTLDDLVDVVDGIETGGITPSGTISITQNGTVDVTQYASAAVNVSGGSSGLSAPYVSASGIFTPSADSNSITIPLGVSISNPILVEGHVIDQEDYLNDDYQYAALGFFTAYPKAVVSTNYNYGTVGVFCVLTTNANKRSYYQQGASLSVTGSNLTVSNTRGVVFKAGIPIRYLVIGYDGTDG